MDLPTFRQLTGPEGSALLEEIAASAGIGTTAADELALGTRLRAQFATDLVAAAMTQHALRRKAATKFGTDATHLWFTPEALQQATRQSVAQLRARRLAEAGVSAVVDLGCGIGSDLIAFAKAGIRVRGVEADPLRAAVAQANLDALGLPGSIECGDATEAAVARDEIPFLDPARRNGRGRVFDPQDMSPAWPVVEEYLQRGAVVKTMPGIPHNLVPPAVEAQWVSDGGDLVEACLWSVRFATAARRATMLPGEHQLTGDGHAAPVGDIGNYLYEPDDAVIRAGLVGALADAVGGTLIDSKIAYLTTAKAQPHPMARRFRIVDELPFREKQLRAALASRDVGTLTVKKRGVNIVPEQLVARLKLKGSIPATIVMTRANDRGVCFLVESA